MTAVNVLLYGEGDFSFTHALSKMDFGYVFIELFGVDRVDRIFATSLDSANDVIQKYPHFCNLQFNSSESPEILICHSVNALLGDDRDRICGNPTHILWNHPHLGKEDSRLHYQLLAHFFGVHKDHSGRIIISLLAGQFERWDVVKAAKLGGEFVLTKSFPFDESQFPGYLCKRNSTGTSFKSSHAVRNSATGYTASIFYIFEKSGIEVVPCPSPKSTDVVRNCATLYTCSTCGKSYNSKFGLKTHTRQFHELQLYEGRSAVLCDQCGKSFAGAEARDSHVKAIHAKRPKVGDVGGIQAVELNRDQSHGLSATAGVLTTAAADDNPQCDAYVCEICESTDPNHLSRFTENEPEWLTCTDCGRVFRGARALNQHRQQRHSDILDVRL